MTKHGGLKGNKPPGLRVVTTNSWAAGLVALFDSRTYRISSINSYGDCTSISQCMCHVVSFSIFFSGWVGMILGLLGSH